MLRGDQGNMESCGLATSYCYTPKCRVLKTLHLGPYSSVFHKGCLGQCYCYAAMDRLCVHTGQQYGGLLSLFCLCWAAFGMSGAGSGSFDAISNQPLLGHMSLLWELQQLVRTISVSLKPGELE